MSAAQVVCCVYVWFMVVVVSGLEGLAARSAVKSGDFMLLTQNTRSLFAQGGIDFEGYRLSVRICSRELVILQRVAACTALLSSGCMHDCDIIQPQICEYTCGACPQLIGEIKGH